MRTRIDQVDRNNLVFQDELLIVNIFQKKIEGTKSLLNSFFNETPFVGRDNPGNNIEWKYLFNSFTTGVNGKCNPLAHEEFFGQLFFFAQFILRDTLKKIKNILIVQPYVFVFIHLVPGAGRKRIPLKEI